MTLQFDGRRFYNDGNHLSNGRIAMNEEDKAQKALAKIAGLLAPGQELTLRAAIDIMAECYQITQQATLATGESL